MNKSSGDKTSLVAQRRAALKRRLMAKGLEYFGKNGVDGTGMSALLAAAETSPGAFYKLYDSKEAFVIELVQEALDPVGDIVDKAGEEAGDPLQAMTIGLRITLELALRFPDWGRFISQTALFCFEKQIGLAPRAMRDIFVAKQTGAIDDDDELLLGAFILGATQSGVSAAGFGLLSPKMIIGLITRTFVALGANPDRVKQALNLNIEAYIDAAIAEGQVRGIFENS